MCIYSYLELAKLMKEAEELNECDRNRIPNMYTKHAVEMLEMAIADRQHFIDEYKDILPILKEEYKKAEIARLTAEIERIKNL